MNKFNVLPIALMMAACASSQPEPVVTPPPQPIVAAVLDPAGSYDFATTVDGQAVNGTFTIAGAPGAYKGRILSNLFPEIPITSAAVEGQTMVVHGTMPDGELTLNLKFTGANYTGSWALGGQSGEFNGKKLPK